MKMAIVSDTHDNLANLKKFLDFSKKEEVKILIHCGDVTKGETLSEIEKNFDGEIYLSLGNADILDSIFKISRKTKIFEKIGELTLEKMKIGFCHKFDFNQKKPFLKNYDFFFFGHTHWPFLKKEGNCILANPGNLAGLYFKASFALFETKTKKIELKILEKLT